MISKSVKAKRRHHAYFYRQVKKIEIRHIDKNVFLTSRIRALSYSEHIEAYNHRQLLQAIRTHLSMIRDEEKQLFLDRQYIEEAQAIEEKRQLEMKKLLGRQWRTHMLRDN